MTDAQRITALEAENADLRERLAALKSEFCGSALCFPASWPITPIERTILRLLASREFVTQDQVLTAFYFDRRDEPNGSIIRVRICLLRKKLREFLPDVVICTRWCLGWFVGPDARAILRGAMS